MAGALLSLPVPVFGKGLMIQDQIRALPIFWGLERSSHTSSAKLALLLPGLEQLQLRLCHLCHPAALSRPLTKD